MCCLLPVILVTVMNVIDIVVTKDEFNVETITTKYISNNLINVLSANLEDVSSESKNSMNCNNQSYSTNPDINTFEINNIL